MIIQILSLLIYKFIVRLVSRRYFYLLEVDRKIVSPILVPCLITSDFTTGYKCLVIFSVVIIVSIVSSPYLIELRRETDKKYEEYKRLIRNYELNIPSRVSPWLN